MLTYCLNYTAVKYTPISKALFHMNHTKNSIIISSYKNKNIKQSATDHIISKDSIKSINHFKRDFNLLKPLIPRNYPNSTNPGYSLYTSHYFLNNILINLMNFLSTQLLINKLGLSTVKSIKLSAGLNWVLKNGIGQISSFFYASNLSQAFERNTKQWRVLSVIIGNTSLFIEMLCNKLHNPYQILALASIAQALKLCGVFGVASTQIKINHHFSKENNIADLQIKYFAQNQIGFCLGSSFGLMMSIYLGTSPSVIQRIISLTSLLYILCAFRSIKHIDFETLNYTRAVILFNEYINSGNLISIKEVNQREGAMFAKVKGLTFACSIEKILNRNKDRDYLRKIMNITRLEKWLIYVDLETNEVMSSIDADANNEDVLEALYTSMIIRNSLNQKGNVITKEEIIKLLSEELLMKGKRKEVIRLIKENKYDINTGLIESKYQRYKVKYSI